MKKIILSIVFLLSAIHPAYALKISPFKTTIEAKSENKTKVFRLENNSDEPTAVQVSVQTWEIEQNGTEDNEDASNEFAVFPAQIVLKPHESRGVRVQWLGSEIPHREKSYRVLAEQIPINLKETPTNVSGVKFMLRFKAALYITPDMPKIDVIVSNCEARPNNILHVEITNNGTAHTIIKSPTLTIISGEGTQTLSGEALKSIDGENVHAGNTRSFDIPLDHAISSKITDAKIIFDSGL